MLVGQLPQAAIDVGAACGVVVALAAACAVLWRIPAVQRVWARNWVEPRQDRIRSAMAEVIAPLQASLDGYGGRLAEHVVSEERLRAEEGAARTARQRALDRELASIHDELAGIHVALGVGSERMKALEAAVDRRRS